MTDEQKAGVLFLYEENKRLEAEIEQLRTALAIYGHHSKNCASIRKGAGACMVFPCDCGLDKALGAE